MCLFRITIKAPQDMATQHTPIAYFDRCAALCVCVARRRRVDFGFSFFFNYAATSRPTDTQQCRGAVDHAKNTLKETPQKTQKVITTSSNGTNSPGKQCYGLPYLVHVTSNSLNNYKVKILLDLADLHLPIPGDYTAPFEKKLHQMTSFRISFVNTP